MSDDALLALADAAGLIVDWQDAGGKPQRVSPDNLRAILEAMGRPCATPADVRDSMARLAAPGVTPTLVTTEIDTPTPLPGVRGRLMLEDGMSSDVADQAPAIAQPGYHRIETDAGVITLAAAPRRCAPLPPGRPWGTAAQIYGLRGRRPAPSGDFAALADFAAAAGRAGADALAISPAHALFAAEPARCSPYSPSSRQFLNVLYAPVEGDLPDGRDLIDWPSAAAARLATLRSTFDRCDRAALAGWIDEQGEPLRRHALFEALHAALGGHGWQDWPESFRDHASAEVARFSATHADEMAFHAFLQQRAASGLATASAAARDAGMRIGLIADIAVGLDPGGSHAWSYRDELLRGIGIGAPPDAIQPAGQNWGITAFSPEGLARTGFRPFIDMLRSAMAHAGGVRIDHILGLRRLWVVPQGASPLDGAYLRYPEQDLLRLVALESHRAGAVVIGEDLGVVPPGFRDMLADRGLHGMRVLPFERDWPPEGDGSFLPPDSYNRTSVAMTSTHDIPTVAGWWTGEDIAWRERLGAPGDRAQERIERSIDRATFWDAVEGDVPLPDDTEAVVDAAVAYVAQAASDLAILPADDLFAQTQAPNLPGTVDEHPNWRRRLPAPADDLFATPGARRRIAAITQARQA